MVKYEQFINGCSMFLDNEMLNKMQDINQRILVGAMLVASRRKAINIFNEIKDNKMVKMFGLVDNDSIDVELLCECLKESMGGNCLKFELPVVGCISINKDDLDKLINYMR